MGYFSNSTIDVIIGYVCKAFVYILGGLGLLVLYGIPIGIGIFLFFCFIESAEEDHSMFQKINAYVHLISLFASAVLIAIYNIEPYRKGYTRAAGVYAIFAVVVTAITMLIGMAQNGNDANNSDGN